MRFLLFIILSSIVLAGCNQEGPPGDEDTTQEETSEENTAGNNNEEESSEEDTDTQTEVENDETEKGSAEDNSIEEDVEEESPVDLLNDVSFIEGYWINYSGVDDARGHMARTEFIPYDQDKDYTVTSPSYVSYYYGEDFIKTNNYGHDVPLIIEKVPEADQVIVSVDKTDIDDIALYDTTLEDAEAAGEVNTTPEELVGRGQLVEEDLTGQIMFGQDFLSEKNLTTGERIDGNGSFIEDENYVVTDALEYNSSADYAITVPASISYYSGRNFIETVEIEDAPAYIPQVSGANYINISFDEAYIYQLNVIEVE